MVTLGIDWSINRKRSCELFIFMSRYGGYDVIFLSCLEEGSSVKIEMISYPCGKYEQIKPSHLFKSVNHTYIILTLDTAYQTKDKSCKFDTGTATARCMNQT